MLILSLFFGATLLLFVFREGPFMKNASLSEFLFAP
jgi:hypothetical protein